MTDFRRALQFVVAAAILQMASCAEFFKPFNVSYDHRALIIGGKRRMLISAGIHYPRATPDMWPDLIAKSKEGGADVIQTYVFWNGHEPVRGQYNFEGRYDLIKFVKLVGSAGLYFHLRIGPYVCAEWNFGGFPLWLRDVPGIQFRTNNEQFKTEMERFVKKIVDLMRQEMLFSWQGGPIILLQIENEYGNIESSYGQSGKEYVKWAAEMALGLGANVPWVMCRQTDAPENIIDACNGFYCDGFKPNSYKKPALWTEDWDGWYTAWGGRVPHRPAEDLAFAVARFFQRGGSFQNYYMYFGGTNFGRTSGGPRYITSYDYDAPIDEYGLLSQPKWGHLKDLHAAIKLCEPALVAVDDAPQYIKLGLMQEAHVYKGSDHIGDFNSRRSGNEICCGFLANIDEHSSTTVEFLGQNYSLPPWSVSILPDCRNVAFNTARVRAQISIKATEVGSPHFLDVVKPEHLLTQKVSSQISKTWFNSKEVIGEWGENSFRAEGILEHLNVTKDTSDYLWYIFRINISAEESSYWETNQVYPKLIIDSIRDVVRIFVNGQLAGSVVGRWVHVEQEVHLVQGYNELAILSETVGLQNYGAFLEKDGAGLRGEVKLSGLKGGELNLSTLLWTYQVGLKGEFRKIYSPGKQESADWSVLQEDSVPYPFTWYKTFFDAPANNRDPVSINLASMGKGQAWVNGHNIGRYWSLVAPKEGCQKTCDYRGAYRTNKCATNCGEVTQSWYHIPRAWLTPSNNLLVIFEETGGNPSEISIQSHSTNLICAQVSEHYYPPLHVWSHPGVLNRSSISSIAPELDLQCDEGQIIATIMFASYGTPAGACQSYSQGNCHAASSVSVVSEACQGRTRCTISVSNKTFGDPCVSVPKRLAVMAECKSPSEIRVGHMSR